MTKETSAKISNELLWYVDNYIVLIDYYDRTISRIAARCVRKGNIALEDYKFYPYILDVLEEICETGNLILEHKELYPYVERKIAGGVPALRDNLAIYEEELENNQSPEMVKVDIKSEDAATLQAGFDKSIDPTVGAGMNIDDLMNKLMAENNLDNTREEEKEEE